MPVISVDPHDKQSLRRRIAEFHSIFDLLARLEDDALTYRKHLQIAQKFLLNNGRDFDDLRAALHNIETGVEYHYKRYHAWNEQIEENWDLASSLNKIVFDEDAEPSALEFGFPLDVIGKPPTDS